MHTGTWFKYIRRMFSWILSRDELHHHCVRFVFCYGLWSMYTRTWWKFIRRMFSWILSMDELDISLRLFFYFVIVSEVRILGLDERPFKECSQGFLAWMNMTLSLCWFRILWLIMSMYTRTWCKFIRRMFSWILSMDEPDLLLRWFCILWWSQEYVYWDLI